MSNQNQKQKILVGAAIATGVLGALAALSRYKPKAKGWSEQAGDAASYLLKNGVDVNKKHLLGGLAGGLIGAAAAILLAPKAGVDLLNDIAHPFSNHLQKDGKTSKKQKSHVKKTVLKPKHATISKKKKSTKSDTSKEASSHPKKSTKTKTHDVPSAVKHHRLHAS